MSFRPLIRGFFFYVLKCVQHYSEENKAFPSPYSGILFLSGCIPKKPKWAKYVSVPSFGDSFFIPRRRSSLQLSAVRVSVPSFGDSFFMVCIERTSRLIMMRFPSPHSGILFLYGYLRRCSNVPGGIVSVPSFGDSFFILLSRAYQSCPMIMTVSVPSFGDSFFIGRQCKEVYIKR